MTTQIERKKARLERFPLSHAEFLNVMEYDPETGVLSWRSPPKRGAKRKNYKPKGYITFKFAGSHYYAHELVWFYVHGRWPQSDVIDHIDRDVHNNRIDNLREATFSENTKNARPSLKVKIADGLYQDNGKFLVKVQKTFDSLEEAKAWLQRVL